MDRVAERAGVGKAALYRRWRSKQDMLVELVGQYATGAVASHPTPAAWPAICKRSPTTPLRCWPTQSSPA